MNLIIIRTIAVISLLFATGCKQKQPVKTNIRTEVNHPIGESFYCNGFRITVTGRDVIRSSNNYYYQQSWQRPGSNYLKLSVTIKNTTNSPKQFQCGAVIMRNQQGSYLYEGFELVGQNVSKLNDEFNPFITASGNLYFEMPGDNYGNAEYVMADDSTNHTVNLGQYN